MVMAPTVSVVMAVKNAARYLRTALDSILAQTYPVSEIVLVDGGSTDDTARIASEYPLVRMIQESGRGYASAWNDGITASTGELIALLDSDDRWAPNKTRLQVEALAADPAAGCIVGHVQFFSEPGRPLPASFKVSLLEGSHVAYMPGALLARRRLFAEVGLFDPSWTVANDIDWFALVKDRGVRILVVPETVIYKRVHDGNYSYGSARTPLINSEMLQTLRNSIHRQRAAAVPASDGAGSQLGRPRRSESG